MILQCMYCVQSEKEKYANENGMKSIIQWTRLVQMQRIRQKKNLNQQLSEEV